MSTVIKVENLSKYYRLGLIGGKTLHDDLNRWWARVRKQPDPLLKIGQEDRQNGNGEYIWALRDLNFEVQQGEIVGIIGRNGAGKSTLLKILSRITAPTSGQVKVKGRIASLLEVGTGFHPELTGRENIYLNGAILGMKKAEIDRKFDEIVAFAEVEKFIDTPVKRYSSGMYVRLAFAVAAHLEPEILLVDEVLAVGDVAFQTKCLGKMRNISQQNGRTILFVSHNMPVVSKLCSKAILLQRGVVAEAGQTVSVIDDYLASSIIEKESNGFSGVYEDEYSTIYKTYAFQPGGSPGIFLTHLPIILGIELELNQPTEGLIVQVRILGRDERRLILNNFDDAVSESLSIYPSGRYIFECVIPADYLARGEYRGAFWVGIHNRHSIADDFGSVRLRIDNTEGIGRHYYAGGDHENVLRPRLEWRVRECFTCNEQVRI